MPVPRVTQRTEFPDERGRTRRLFDAVDAIDRLRDRICGVQEMRDEVLQLHAMAHVLINGETAAGGATPIILPRSAVPLLFEAPMRAFVLPCGAATPPSPHKPGRR